MWCVCFQDWVTLRGSSATTTITQGEDYYLDVPPVQDAIIWTHVSNTTLSGATQFFLAFETSPSKDDSYFVTLANAGSPISPLPVGVQVSKGLMASATNPLGRYLRWKMNVTGATSAWDVTFRLYVALNTPGPDGGLSLPFLARAAGPSLSLSGSLLAPSGSRIAVGPSFAVASGLPSQPPLAGMRAPR